MLVPQPSSLYLKLTYMSSANLIGIGRVCGKGCAMMAALMPQKLSASIRSTLAPIPPSSAGAPKTVACKI